MSVTLSEALRALAHEWSPDVAYLIQSAASELDRLNAAEQERVAEQVYADVPETRMPEVQIPCPDPVRAALGRALVKSVDERMMALVPDAALDAEAEALWSAWYGDMPRDLSWRDLTDSGKADWRRVALKAREMHAKRASASECAKVYFAAHGSYRDGVRAVLEHLGVEVTP